jgi:hypothetical protein
MRRQIRSTLVLASLVLLGSAAAQETVPPTSAFFEEAKITVNERARANGYLRVRITPEGGQSLEATIVTEKRMNENEIAKTLAEALKPAFAPAYEVDKDAGEHVKIRKAKRESANFSVEITFSSPGFAIILDN